MREREISFFSNAVKRWNRVTHGDTRNNISLMGKYLCYALARFLFSARKHALSLHFYDHVFIA